MIKVEAWQSAGIKKDHCVETYDFCCWDSLHKWLSNFAKLNQCPECIRRRRIEELENQMEDMQKEINNLKKDFEPVMR